MLGGRLLSHNNQPALTLEAFQCGHTLFFVKPHKMSAVVAALLPGFRACFQMRNKFNIAQSTEVAKYGVLYEIGFYRVSCFVLAVPLHNSLFLSICFPLLFSSTPPPFSSIKLPCATMQHLITLFINTPFAGSGRWGSCRNSRCLLLLLTSASTAVKLDHCDANLRRCCNPGEEPGSIRLVEREEEEEKEEGGRQ